MQSPPLDLGVVDFGSLIRVVSLQLGAENEARWLVANAAGVSGSDLITRLHDVVPARVESVVRDMVARRLAGEPLQYVLGECQFRELQVKVDRRVLIPRPETEQVVEYALAELTRSVQRHRASKRDGPRFVAADLGTGSGVIALSLAVERPRNESLQLEVWATDASSEALVLAQDNLARCARALDVSSSRVRLVVGDWFAALPARLLGAIDLIVSNPPYVSDAEWEVLDPGVRDHEPRPALVAGPTGIEALTVIVNHAPRWLTPDGSLVLEIAPGQASAAAALARSAGFSDVSVRPDLAGLPRALVARRRP